MPSTTNNYYFTKPDPSDRYDITHFNRNMDELDRVISTCAKNRNLMTTAAGTFNIGGTITLNESILGKNPIFLDMEYTVGSGRVSGSVGSRMLNISVIGTSDSGIAIKYVTFGVSDDGLRLTVNAVRHIKMLSSGNTVTNNGSVAINGVYVIGE